MPTPVMPQNRTEIIVSYNGEMFVKAYENEFFLSGGLIQQLTTNFALNDFQQVEFNITGHLAESGMPPEWFDNIKAELTLMKMKGGS